MPGSSYPELRFEVVDVQVGNLAALAPGGFDRVISEFGVMFFDDPVAAFTNIAGAMGSPGAMAFACWRSLDENQMFALGTHLLVERMPEPPPPPGPHQPGPTVFADDSYLARVLDDGRLGRYRHRCRSTSNSVSGSTEATVWRNASP